MTIVAVIFLIIYLIFILVISAAWKPRPYLAKVGAPAQRSVSVVVPVRNEANNLPHLLSDLLQQRYDDFEVIVVDDHSTDNTVAVIENLNPATIRIIKNSGNGKKSAIATGIALAQGEIIVTTDADCRVHKHWLAGVNAAFSSDKIKMVMGAVSIAESKNIFARMQQLELASLMGTSAASLQLGFPTMCNGANLAFRRQVFLDVNGYDGNLHIASGDDEFLMRKIHARYPDSLAYNPSDPVITLSQSTPSLFFQQRLRWASKWKFNSSIATRALAVFVFAVQIISTYLLFQATLGDVFFLWLFLIKVLADLFIILHFTSWLHIRFYFTIFVVVQLLYPLYVTGVGLLSLFVPYSWKGRTYA